MGYLEHEVSKREENEKYEDEESYCMGMFCDFIDRFTALKMRDSAEKMPLLIGPKSFNLVKIRRK